MTESATKLMSGYIELTVKKAGDAFKEITTEITGVGKQADKVGKQAGKSIGDGITKGARDGGKAVNDELSAAAKSAEDAGKKAGDALEKGVTRGAKRAGKSVQDEISKAGTDAGKAAGQGVSKGMAEALRADPAVSRAFDKWQQRLQEFQQVSQDLRKAQADQERLSSDNSPGALQPWIEARKRASELDVKYRDLQVSSQNALRDYNAEVEKATAKLEKLRKKHGDVAEATKKSGDAAKDASKAHEGLVKTIGKELLQAVPADVVGDQLGNLIEGGLQDVIGGSGWGKALSKSLGDFSAAGAEAWLKGMQANLDKAADSSHRAMKSLVDLGSTGTRVGDALLKAFEDSPVGKWVDDKLQPIVEDGHRAADTWGKFRDTMLGIDEHKLDPLAGTLKGIAGTDLHPVAASMLDIVGTLNKSGDAAGKAGGLAGALAKVGGTAGQLAAAAAAWKAIVDLSGDVAKIPGVPGAVDWIQKAPAAAGGWVHSHLHLPTLTPDPELTKPGGMFGPPAGTQPPRLGPQFTPRPGAPAAADVILNPAFMSRSDKDWSPSGYAAGGVAGVSKSGKLFGPGTGTSDSIIGVDANGVPTARVSVGEGIVRKSAMEHGADKFVAALNSGWLPRFDDGGIVPPTPNNPVPQIKVPEATSGAAGNFNQWLQTQQGKPYQYGTMYDCSGFMSQVYNQLTGKQLPRFNTESDLAAYGFVRGSKAGTFQLGIHHGGGGPNSHMAGTLPDGRSVESGGNGVQIGAGAHGAFDPQFEDHWFLPGSENFLGGAAGPPPQGSLAGLPAGPARTQGFIPAGAGASGHAGTSFASGLYQMGASAINGLIDQAASAAATAVSMGAMAGSFGAGGQAAGSAASFAIGLGTQAAKRGVQYTAQMAGIGTDALAEILMPFGVPRFFQTDPTQFMPQLPNMAAAVTTGEKAQQAAQGNGQAQPGGPVQPGQLPGQQPVGSPVQFAQPQGIMPTATPIVGPSGPPPKNVAGIKPPPGPIVPGMGQPTQGVGAPVVPAPSGSFLDSWLPNLIGHRKGGVVGVYDDGGWLMPGGLAINQSKRPEPILNSAQWGDIQEIAGRPMPAPDPQAVRGGGGDYSMHFGEGSIIVKDVEELQRELSSRQRLESMRHRGRP